MKKNDLFRVIDGFSGDEKKEVVSYLSHRKFRTELVTWFKIFSGLIPKINESGKTEPSSSAMYRITHDLSNAIFDYLVDKEFVAESFEDRLIKLAKAYIRIGDYFKAFKCLKRVFGYASNHERFATIEIIRVILIDLRRNCHEEDLATQMATLIRNVASFLKAYPHYLAVLELHQDYSQKALHESAQDEGSEEEELRQLWARLTAFPAALPSKKYQLLYNFLRYSLSFTLQNYDSSQKANSKVITLLEKHDWLQKEFPDYLPKAMHFRVTLASVLGNQELAIQGLSKLDPSRFNDDPEYAWRFIQSQLIIADYFNFPEYTQKAETYFYKVEKRIKKAIQEKEFIKLLYYFAKNKVLFYQKDRLSYYLHQIRTYNKTAVRSEIQLYSRIIEIVCMWLDGQPKQVTRLVKNCRAFMERTLDTNRFPQAASILDFVSGTKIDLNLTDIQLRNALLAFENLKTHKAPDLKYLPFYRILERHFGKVEVR